MLKNNSFSKLAAFSWLVTSLLAHADGPTIIPDGVPGGGEITLTDAEYREAPDPGIDVIIEAQLSCYNANLRTVSNPVTRNSTLTWNIPTTAGTVKFQFKTEIFFTAYPTPPTLPQPTMGFAAPLPPAGSRYEFDPSANMARLYINWPSPSGKVQIAESGTNKFKITQSGIGKTKATAGAYNAYDGDLWTTQVQNAARYDSANNKAYLKISAKVQAQLNETLTNTQGTCTGWRSPLYLFFDEKRPQFTGVSDFPLDATGLPVRWVEPGAPGYLLVFDRNRDGKITDANELFGDNGDSNGFEVLKELDSNKDGVFDAKDKAFARLQLWRDRNGDGKSEPSELSTLADKSVLSINLKYTKNNITHLPSGVEFREFSSFKFADARGATQTGAIIDVWLGTTLVTPVAQSGRGLVPIGNFIPFGKTFMNSWLSREPASTKRQGL